MISSSNLCWNVIQQIKMDFSPLLRDYSPVIPDEVIAHFMNMAGVDTSVPHVLSITGMATQKFVSDIGNSALQFCIERDHMTLDTSDTKLTLNTEDLNEAFREYDDALDIAKPADYYV